MTAVVLAGGSLAIVPTAVATAQDTDFTPRPIASYSEAPPVAVPHGLDAHALSARTRANVLRDGGSVARGVDVLRKLVAKNDKLAHKLARANNHKLDRSRTDVLRAYSRPRLRAENHALSGKLHKLDNSTAGGGQASTAGGGSQASPQLQAIAACESGGDPASIGGGGAFRGKYQFTYGTWASVGGSGDPAAAPEAEQDKRAQMLLQHSGSSPWPVCGR